MNQKKIRIVFMGTPDFAVQSLRVLVENKYNIVGVITAPDRPAGRGQKLKQSPVKEYALTQSIPVLQPDKLKDSVFINDLKALQADLQIIVAFRMLPEIVWNMPPLGSVNLHGSLLPQYRGAAPINWAVINGEKETGVTTFFLQHEIDTGNVLYSEKITIEEKDNAGTVHDKLMIIGADLILKTVQAIELGNTNPTPQSFMNTGELKSAPKIFKEDCRIDWPQSAEMIQNKIRGLSPYPTAWTEIETNEGSCLGLKIFDSTIGELNHLKPGEIESDGKTYFSIGTGTSNLYINDLQMAGKKRMTTIDFLRGFKTDTIKKIN